MPSNKKTKKEAKSVKVFAWASLLNDLGANMIFPIWPIFLTTILGANMSILGLVDGISEALVSLSQAGAGYLSDRTRKRKPFIWLGYLMGGISRFGYAASTVWTQVIPFRVLDRMGKIRDAPRDAIVADESTTKNRGKNFGYLKSMDKVGGVFGIALCILLFNYLGYQTLFAIAAIPSLISALLVLKFIREKKDGNIKLYKGIKVRQLGEQYKLFLALSAIFALGSFSYSFLLIFAKEAGFSLAFIPVLYLIYTMFAAGLSSVFGKMLDKLGRKTIMNLSIFLWMLICATYLLTNNIVLIILTFVLYGLHIASLEPAQKTIVSELAPKKYRASALGGFQTVVGLCALPASFMAGVLWDMFGKTVPFALSLALAIIALILLNKLEETKK